MFLQRRLVGLVLAMTAFATTDLPGAEPLKNGDRIVFLGDSITQAGAGPGGYVTLVREALVPKSVI